MDEAESGHSDDCQEPVVTDRGIERQLEDDQFVPVIVKRSDEGRRHPDDILELAVKEGLEQIRRPALSLALSSVAAGLILGFTAMSVAVAAKFTAPYEGELVTRIATALASPPLRI